MNEKNPVKTLQGPQRTQLQSPLERMEALVDDIFSRGLSTFSPAWPAWPEMGGFFADRFPRVDVIDREQEIVVRAELPGVSKDDLDVTLGHDSLTIRASMNKESEQEEGQYYRRETSRGEFHRTLALPAAVDDKNTKASFNDGILEIVAPKLEASKGKKIKID